MTTMELTQKVRNLKELKAYLAELEADITTAEDEIKAEMTAREVDELKVDVFTVRWTKVISNRFDTGTFKKAYADLAEQFTKATESRRFSIA